jgi:hypothetical protein
MLSRRWFHPMRVHRDGVPGLRGDPFGGTASMASANPWPKCKLNPTGHIGASRSECEAACKEGALF